MTEIPVDWKKCHLTENGGKVVKVFTSILCTLMPCEPWCGRSWDLVVALLVLELTAVNSPKNLTWVEKPLDILEFYEIFILGKLSNIF